MANGLRTSLLGTDWSGRIHARGDVPSASPCPPDHEPSRGLRLKQRGPRGPGGESQFVKPGDVFHSGMQARSTHRTGSPRTWRRAPRGRRDRGLLPAEWWPCRSGGGSASSAWPVGKPPGTGHVSPVDGSWPSGNKPGSSAGSPMWCLLHEGLRRARGLDPSVGPTGGGQPVRHVRLMDPTFPTADLRNCGRATRCQPRC